MKRFFYVLLPLFLGSCEKLNPFTIDASAITSTDASGNVIGSTDPSDWATDAAWNATEESLFRMDPIDISYSMQATIEMKPGFANPVANRNIKFHFNSSAKTFLKIAIADVSANKKAFYALAVDSGYNVYNLNFDPSVFKNNTNYRIYYAFATPLNGFYFKGHGDIKIQD